MRKILETIQHNYIANGKNEKDAIVIDSKKEIENHFYFGELNQNEFEKNLM